jgi:glutathione S-transferase
VLRVACLPEGNNHASTVLELIEQGGKRQVPCLRITKEDGEVEWLYESKEIRRYLQERYGETG